MKFQYFNPMRFCFLVIPALIFWGCPDSASTTDTDSPLGELQFTFLQDDHVLYFAIDLAPSVKGCTLETAMVSWYGTDATRMVTPDHLELKDEGENGDILKDDGLYSLKVINNTLTQNPILSSDIGRVYVEFQATYGNVSSFMVEDSFSLGNIIPQIVYIAAPDTIVRPSDSGVIFELVKAKVHDANGLEDIRRVGFVSYHVEGDSFLNVGILLIFMMTVVKSLFMSRILPAVIWQ